MKLPEEAYQFITKVAIPAMVGVSLKVAIQMRKQTVSLASSALSAIVGVSMAYILSSIVETQVPKTYQSMCYATIGISGQQIGEYLVYRMNLDGFLEAIFSAIKDVIIRLIK